MENKNDYDIHDNSRNIIFGIIVFVLIFFSSLLGACVGTCIKTYNNLVDMEENVNHQFANVQTQMQSRVEKIPDLVKVADEAANHLENINEIIVQGRKMLSEAKTTEELDNANKQITATVDNIVKIINENYPTVTASEQYTSLMDSIEGAANRIAVAREDYNSAVTEYNKTVRHFPGSLLANIFGFETMEDFKASDAANNDSLVNFGD